jgi:uncharacterized HAD superfamily protein
VARVGFDIDGVLANFNSAYMALVRDITGRDLFPVDYKPHCWAYPEELGYTVEEVKKVWAHITNSDEFWIDLKEEPGAAVLARHYPSLVIDHDIYFCTSRPGRDAKWQSEVWLSILLHNPTPSPTVLISSHKGACAKALNLDVYIDDNFDNVWDVYEQSPTTRTYLLDREYNRLGALPTSVRRIPTVEAMFESESLLKATV